MIPCLNSSSANWVSHNQAYVHTDTDKYTHSDTHIPAYMYEQRHTKTYIHTCTHIHTQAHRYRHTHKYIQTNTHTHTHTHSHTCRQTQVYLLVYYKWIQYETISLLAIKNVTVM